MMYSITRLQELYSAAVRRVVYPVRCEHVVRYAGSRIDGSDYLPDVWQLADVGEGEVAVEGMRGGIFVFSKRRLESAMAGLVNTIKLMPRGVRKSVSADGIPWIMARRARNLQMAGINDVEHLVCMSVAVGLLKVTPSKMAACPMPFISIDDVRMVRMEKIKSGKKLRCILNWFSD